MDRWLTRIAGAALSSGLVACGGSATVTQAAGSTGSQASTSSDSSATSSSGVTSATSSAASTGAGGATGTGGSGTGGVGTGGGASVEVLATLQDQPVALAVIGSEVYVALFSAGIVTVPVAGGGTTLIVASVTGYSEGVYFQNPFVFDHDNVYFAESSGGYTTGPIARAPLAGGQATVLTSSMGFTAGIAIDASNVYWVDQDQNTINRIPIAGGTVASVAGGLKTPGGLALQEGTLYFTDAGGDLLSVPTIGGSVKTLFTGPGLPPNTTVADFSPPVVADSSNVYFSVCSGGGGASTLYRAPRAGGAPIALASSCASGIAVDETHVYWAENDTVYAVPIAGGAQSVVATPGQLISAGPAVDASSVYWGVTTTGSCGLCPPPKAGQINGIMKAPKPQ